MSVKLTEIEVVARLRRVGVTLLGRYVNNGSRVRVRCQECAHVWQPYVQQLFHGHGCPECRRNRMRLTPQEVDARLKRLGLRRLSAYRDCSKRLHVKCSSCDYDWRTAAGGLLCSRHGCPRCAGALRLPIKEVRARLRRVGVRLLGSYKNSYSRVTVRCLSCQYEWQPVAGQLSRGRGCPLCHGRGGVAENEIRRVVERVTGWKFIKARPDWLRGRSVQAMELDGYNEKHQIAFEYQGYQHYRAIKFFGGDSTLRRNRRNDERKRQLCRRHGVLLIRIPYWKRDVETFVRTKLEQRRAA